MHNQLSAMILAAGFGTRMRPLTDHCPKALVPFLGKPLIDHALDQLLALHPSRTIINAHYRADQLQAHLDAKNDPRLMMLYEPEILETGGGVLNALPHLSNPFIALNSDGYWRSHTDPAPLRLIQAFNPDLMDALLLLTPAQGKADFALAPDGRLSRNAQGYTYVGMQILTHRLFDTASAGAFSLNVLYDQAIAKGRLYGLVHEGEFLDLTSLEQLRAAEVLCHL